MHRDKEYVGIMRVHADISEDDLKKEMEKFIGKINQLPPVRSRVKRAIREREVKKFEILEKDGKDVLFVADVQAGTYIRKLISDLGENIGGAHMLELRRTKAGVFSEEDKNFINLYDFEKAVEEYKKGSEDSLKKILIPGEEAIKLVLPVLNISESLIKQLLIGKPIMKSDITNINKLEEKFAIFCEERFIGIYRKVSEGDIIARAEFVFN